MGHGRIGGFVIQQALGLPEDCVCVRAGQANGSGLDSFGPFGRVAGDEDGFSERGRFFLNASRIGDDQMGAIHEPDEGQIIKRLDQVDTLNILENGAGGALNIGVEMNGIDNLNIPTQGQ